MGSRRRGRPGPKTPRGRHAGCARRRNHDFAQSPTEVWAKLVNQGRHAAHTASLDELPETARPPWTGRTHGWDRNQSLREGATVCLRARPTDSLRVIPAAEFVGMGRRFMGIEKDVAVRCPCCDAVDVDIRHARICPRAGSKVN